MAKNLKKDPTNAYIVATCCSILGTTPGNLIDEVQKLADATGIREMKEENKGLRRLLELTIIALGSESGYLSAVPMLVQLRDTFSTVSGESRVIDDDMAEGPCVEWVEGLTMIAPKGQFSPASWGDGHNHILLAPRGNLNDLQLGQAMSALVLVTVNGMLVPVSIAAAHSQPVLQYVYQQHREPSVCLNAREDRRYELTWSDPIDPKLIEAAYGKKAAVRARPDKPAIELLVKYVGDAAPKS